MGYVKDAIIGNPKGKTLWQQMVGEDKERVDLDFPMGIRLPSRLLIDFTNIYLIEKDVGWTDNMIGNSASVKSGHVLEYDGKKDYIFTIEDDLGKDAILFCEASDAIPTLFVQTDEIFPDSPDEWESWLSMKNGIMTGKQLESPDGDVYTRCWGTAERQEPLRYTEKVYEDRYSAASLGNQLQVSLFVRDISGVSEYVMFIVQNNELVQILTGAKVHLTKVIAV